MTLNHRDSETSTLTYNTDTPITTYNIEPASDEAKTETPTITYNTEPTSDEIKETLLGRFWRHSRNIAAGLLFAMGTQALLTGCSPENEPIPNNQTEININVFNNGADIDISNSPIVKIEGNTLKVEYNTLAQWPENITDAKIIVSPSKYFTNTTEIASGTKLSQDLNGQFLGVKIGEKKKLIGELVDKVEEKINTLQNLNYKVDEPVDLTLGGTLNIVEASFELDGETTNLNTSSAIFPYPGTGTLNVKCQIANGTIRNRSFNINVKPEIFTSIEFSKIEDTEVLPIIGEVEMGDPHFYEHIKQLGITGTVQTINMMKKYGNGRNGPEEYKELMSKFRPVMIGENPSGFSPNVDYIPAGNGTPKSKADNHAHKEMYIMKTLLPVEIKPIVINTGDFEEDLETLKNLCKNNPDKIFVAGFTLLNAMNETDFKSYDRSNLIDCSKISNLIIIGPSSRIEPVDGNLINQINHKSVKLTNNAMYGRTSNARGKNDNNTNNNIYITFPTDKDGKVTLDGANEGGRYQKGFADGANGILFSGRGFATHNNITGKIESENVYSSSLTTYTNIPFLGLCYLVNPGANNANAFSGKVKSTADNDQVSMNGETSHLILINPKKYCLNFSITPNNFPTQINSGEIIPLEKPYPLGIFDIPGAMFQINGVGDLIPYDKSTESILLSQDLSKIKRYYSGPKARKLGLIGQTVHGKFRILDDEYKSLYEEDDMPKLSVQITK